MFKKKKEPVIYYDGFCSKVFNDRLWAVGLIRNHHWSQNYLQTELMKHWDGVVLAMKKDGVVVDLKKYRKVVKFNWRFIGGGGSEPQTELVGDQSFTGTQPADVLAEALLYTIGQRKGDFGAQGGKEKK